MLLCEEFQYKLHTAGKLHVSSLDADVTYANKEMHIWISLWVDRLLFLSSFTTMSLHVLWRQQKMIATGLDENCSIREFPLGCRCFLLFLTQNSLWEGGLCQPLSQPASHTSLCNVLTSPLCCSPCSSLPSVSFLLCVQQSPIHPHHPHTSAEPNACQVGRGYLIFSEMLSSLYLH